MLKYHTEIMIPKPIEPAHKKYILIREQLAKTFNEQQWKQISKHNSQWSSKIQDKIFTWLMLHQQLFQQYFHLFYQNHVTLFHWFLLSSHRHQQIRPYLYKKLLIKSQERFKKQVKYLQLQNIKDKQRQAKQFKIKSKFKYQGNQHSVQHSQHANKCKLEDLSNQIFSFVTKKQKNPQKQTPKQTIKHTKNMSDLSTNTVTPFKQTKKQEHMTVDCLQQKLQQKQQTKNRKIEQCTFRIKNHDFHDLFVKTFHACDGPRYIFYDYEKHMKGKSQKDKYNMFIRSQSRGKIVDVRMTESSEEQPVFRDFGADQLANLRASYQYSSYGSAVEGSTKKRSKVIFRKTRSQNIGKFIRK